MKVRFIVKETGEVREQDVFMGDFPLMTDSGTFVINGTERVVVTQLVRSPGAYIMEPKDPTKQVLTASLMPGRGSWLEFEVEAKGYVSVRIDRKRKLPVTVLLKALGMGGPEEILSRFDDSWLVRNTLERDDTPSRDEALLEVFRRQRPGEPVNIENAQNLVDGLFFDAKRYDLSEVGRYKVNKKLKLDVPLDNHTLTIEDIEALLEAPHRDRRGGRRGGGVRAGQLRAHPPQARRVRALRQQAPQDRRGAGAGGVPDRDVPHGARGARADDDPGRGFHNAPERRQRQAREQRHKGVLRLLAALAVHGPDQYL